MKLKWLLVLVVLIVVVGIGAWLMLGGSGEEATQVTWEQSYGGEGRDNATRVLLTEDGGTVIAGGLSRAGENGKDSLNAWVIRLDAAGKTVWEQRWGGAADELMGDIQATADGGFIVTGETQADISGVGSVWVTHLDKDGKSEWTHHYESTRNGASHSILPMPDGGYVVAGTEQSENPNYYDGWVARLDAQGKVIWDKFLGGEADDSLAAIRATEDGNILAVGQTDSKGAGRTDAWIVKLDTSGNVMWEKTYGSPNPDAALDVLALPDKGFIVAGWSEAKLESHKRDGWLIRIDANGEKVWEHVYGGYEPDEARSVHATKDSGFIVAGTTRSKGDGSVNAWVFRVNAKGGERWQRSFGGREVDEASSVVSMLDGAFVVAGQTSKAPATAPDAWVVRLNALGKLN